MSYDAPTYNADLQASVTPDQAIQLLKDGNRRFLDNTPAHRDLHAQVATTSSGQYPFAIVQGCIDSRVPVETVFDAGVGDIFVTRIAGNAINGDQMGGMEYACKVTGSKVVVIMGHTRCGAVTGALSGVELGNLTGLLEAIKPSAEAVGPYEAVTPELVDQVVEANVRRSVARIRAESPVLNDLEQSGAIKIVGAVYHVTSGEVVFLD